VIVLIVFSIYVNAMLWFSYLLSMYYIDFEFVYPVCVVFIVHCDCPATSFYGKRYVLYGIYCSIAFNNVAEEYDAVPQSAASISCIR